MNFDRDLFAEAKRVACGQIAQAAGVKLRRSGGRLIGACPLCGGDGRSTRFHVTLERNLWICRACGEGGSPVDLELHLRGGAPLDAARRLVGSEVFTFMPPRSATPSAPRFRVWASAAKAAELWRGASADLTHCGVAHRYLESRGIAPGHVLPALRRLRFHPSAFAAGERAGGGWKWRANAPAILAPIVDTSNRGRIIGVHATYLRPDGSGKAELFAPSGEAIPARKMWGRAQGGVVALTRLRPGPGREACSWCHPQDGFRCAACGRENDGEAGEGPLFVGEGLETTLSALAFWTARAKSVRAAAALSLDNMQGRWLKDDEGCATQWPPCADPAKPPWLLPDAGHVVVIVDRDMSPILVKRRDEAGAAKRMRLGAEQRAQLCADLAVQHWRNAGVREVEIALPLKLGADLNDMVKYAA